MCINIYTSIKRGIQSQAGPSTAVTFWEAFDRTQSWK